MWVVLGPARLLFTLATGEVTSNAGAGRYAARQFPGVGGAGRAALARRPGQGEGSYVTADAVAVAAMIDAIVKECVATVGLTLPGRDRAAKWAMVDLHCFVGRVRAV